MSRKLHILLIVFIFFNTVKSYGQSAVPFLMIPTSAEGNGMGGIAASLISDDAISTISNPAQLGIFSLDNIFNASTYTPKTPWLPSFSDELSLDATAFNAGINLKNYIPLPAPISLGIGYSQVYFDLGNFNLTSLSNPQVISSFHAYDRCDNLSFGIGIDYKVKLSLGYTFKWIDSELPGIGSEGQVGIDAAKLPAHDYGAILQVPVIDVISDASEMPIEFNNKVAPMFDLTFGYERRNVGGEINYDIQEQSDPLPRQGVLGWNFEIGFKSEICNRPWKLLSFTWGREAEDILVIATYPENISAAGDTTYSRIISYKNGLGGIRPFNNLVLGHTYGQISLQTGWQFQVAECFYIRGGSYTSPDELIYSTHGESFKLNGFLRLLASLNIIEPGSKLFSCFLDHFDLQYHVSNYTSTSSPIDGTTFKAINIVIR
ncbi:MAG: hypothetical protein WAO19_04735 [Candidatus Kryptoniota bacterium]